MERLVNRSLLTILAAVSLAAVVAPDIARAEDEVVERVVVRNRKYHLSNRLEVTPTVGFSLTNRLTSHTNFQLGLAYNLTEQWAIEGRGGFALSSLSSLAETVKEDDLVEVQRFDDFSDMWRIEWQALLMPRWTPIYGKINLVTEVPIHFQAYLTAGGGAVGLTKESVLYRQAGQGLEQQTTTWAAAAGGGLRFFLSDMFMLRLELLDLMHPDSYHKGLQKAALDGEQPGSDPKVGTLQEGEFTHALFFNLGASVVF